MPPRLVSPRTTQEVHHLDGNPGNVSVDNLRVVSRTEPLLTAAEAASHLGVGHTTVRNWIRSGKLGVVPGTADAYRIPESEVVRLLEERERGRRWLPESVGRR